MVDKWVSSLVDKRVVLKAFAMVDPSAGGLAGCSVDQLQLEMAEMSVDAKALAKVVTMELSSVASKAGSSAVL